MKCEKCGHTHSSKEDCTNSFCIECGLGGDLTAMPCDPTRKTKLEEAIDRLTDGM